MTESKRIGELNGPWSWLLKVMLVVLPVFVLSMVTWATWVTKTVHTVETRISEFDTWRQNRPGFITADQARTLRLEIEASLRTQIDQTTSIIISKLDDNKSQLNELRLMFAEHRAEGKTPPKTP